MLYYNKMRLQLWWLQPAGPAPGRFSKVNVLNSAPDPWASNSSMHTFPWTDVGSLRIHYIFGYTRLQPAGRKTILCYSGLCNMYSLLYYSIVYYSIVQYSIV